MERETKATLEQFYAAKPSLRILVEGSAGYGVFSNIDGQYSFFGGGNGYGLVFDRQTGHQTFMKRLALALGFGFGLRDFRTLFVFQDRDTLARFVSQGWDVSADVSAVFQSESKGAAITEAGNPLAGVQIWELNRSGLILKAAVKGSKAWTDPALTR